MSSRPVSNPPSYICDNITYGVGILASFGFGGGQAYQMVTQGASSQGWTGVAGITLAFAVSTFAIIRSSQHQRAAQQPQDVERAPLLRERVDYGTNLQAVAQKLDQICRQLQLPESETRGISVQDQETPEQRITRQIEAIFQHCLLKQKEVGQLQRQLKSSEQTVPTSVEMGQVPLETKVKRLERDLKDATEDLKHAQQRIEALEGVIAENEIASSLFQRYTEELERQFTELTQRDTGQSPQTSAITSILLNMRKVNTNNTSRSQSATSSRSQSATSSPFKKPSEGTPADKRVSFLDQNE